MEKGFGHEINDINKAITNYINENLLILNITRSEIPYLLLIYNNKNISQESLSQKLGYNESTIARAIKRLEKKDFVKRVPDLSDGRKKLVQLTDNGFFLTESLIEKNKEFEIKLKNAFSDDEKKEFIRLSKKFLEVFS